MKVWVGSRGIRPLKKLKSSPDRKELCSEIQERGIRCDKSWGIQREHMVNHSELGS